MNERLIFSLLLCSNWKLCLRLTAALNVWSEMNELQCGKVYGFSTLCSCAQPFFSLLFMVPLLFVLLMKLLDKAISWIIFGFLLYKWGGAHRLILSKKMIRESPNTHTHPQVIRTCDNIETESTIIKLLKFMCRPVYVSWAPVPESTAKKRTPSVWQICLDEIMIWCSFCAGLNK